MLPPGPSVARRWVGGTSVVYLVVVGLVTLGPQPADTGTMTLVRRVVAALAHAGLPVTYLGVEAVANVLLFVPYGVLGGLLVARRRWWAVLLAASATSAAIETIQRGMPTRYSTLQDWLLNTLGAALGLVLLAVAHRLRERRHATKGRARPQA